MTARRFNPALLQVASLAIATLAVAAIGCGKGGVPRYQLSGTATFNGKPIPKGMVTIEADRSQGNTGPASTANIVDGRYTTPSDRGVIDGPLTLVVYGYDGSPPNEASVHGKALFPPFEDSIEVDGEDTVHNIEVTR